MTQILFLTACVNPKGMAYTKLSNPEIRLQQYKDALNWYLENTDMKILLVENSGYDFSDSYQKQIDEGRMEMLCYDGNDYDRSRGKGYGEAAIMEYGITHSRLLSTAPPHLQIVKITGRLLCLNINDLCRSCKDVNTVYANISKDDWDGNIATSQVVMAPVSFFKELFLPRREEINDSKCRHFEHVLYDSIQDWTKKNGHHCMFWTPPAMEGVSGTSGAKISSAMSATQLLRYRIMFVLRQYFGYRGYENPFYHGQPKKPIEL